MKLLTAVSTNADFSHNRSLEQFMAKYYQDQVEIEVYGTVNLPRFKEEAQPDNGVKESKNKIREADGVIFATPEYNHGIPSSLKSAMEWTDSHAQGDADAVKIKPAMVLGASYGIQGVSRTQGEMRGILLSPDQGANVLPGDGTLIGHAADKSDKNTEDLLDQETIHATSLAFNNFTKFVEQAKK